MASVDWVAPAKYFGRTTSTKLKQATEPAGIYAADCEVALNPFHQPVELPCSGCSGTVWPTWDITILTDLTPDLVTLPPVPFTATEYFGDQRLDYAGDYYKVDPALDIVAPTFKLLQYGRQFGSGVDTPIYTCNPVRSCQNTWLFHKKDDGSTFLWERYENGTYTPENMSPARLAELQVAGYLLPIAARSKVCWTMYLEADRITITCNSITNPAVSSVPCSPFFYGVGTTTSSWEDRGFGTPFFAPTSYASLWAGNFAPDGAAIESWQYKWSHRYTCGDMIAGTRRVFTRTDDAYTPPAAGWPPVNFGDIGLPTELVVQF